MIPKKNVMQLDPKCLSCSGQGSSLISTFKLACLAYTPSPVIFRSKISFSFNVYRYRIHKSLDDIV